jgi:Ca2+-binding EF-hand superfamily protein
MGDRLDEDQVEEMLDAAVHGDAGQLDYSNFVRGMLK